MISERDVRFCPVCMRAAKAPWSSDDEPEVHQDSLWIEIDRNGHKNQVRVLCPVCSMLVSVCIMCRHWAGRDDLLDRRVDTAIVPTRRLCRRSAPPWTQETSSLASCGEFLLGHLVFSKEQLKLIKEFGRTAVNRHYFWLDTVDQK